MLSTKMLHYIEISHTLTEYNNIHLIESLFSTATKAKPFFIKLESVRFCAILLIVPLYTERNFNIHQQFSQ